MLIARAGAAVRGARAHTVATAARCGAAAGGLTPVNAQGFRRRPARQRFYSAGRRAHATQQPRSSVMGTPLSRRSALAVTSTVSAAALLGASAQDAGASAQDASASVGARRGVHSASLPVLAASPSSPSWFARLTGQAAGGADVGAEADPLDSQFQPDGNPLWDTVVQAIHEQPVFMVSKTWCGFCGNAKRLLSKYTDTFAVVEIDEEAPVDAAHVQAKFGEITGSRTVPKIFIGGRLIGGHDDLLALARMDPKGLQEMIDAATAARQQ